MSFLNFI